MEAENLHNIENTAGTIASLISEKELQDINNLQESNNPQQEEKKQTEKKTQRNKERPDKSTEEESNKKENLPGNLSNLVEVGDPVMLAKEPIDGRYTWFIVGIQPDEEGEDILTIEYRGDHPDLKEERKVRWEDITPRYESAEIYQKKLRQYQKALDSAIESGDDFSRFHLGQVRQQIIHFAQIFYNTHRE